MTMRPHICPWWGGYFIDNRFRRWLHDPQRILAPYVQPRMTAMDFGCGMGMFAIGMAQLVGDDGRVIAVDLQPRMLDVLLKRAKEAGVKNRIRTHCCQADSLDFSEPIDFALAFYSVHEVPDVRRLLCEIQSCLRPNGRLMVVEPIGHVTEAGFQNTLSIAEQVGLQVQERPQVRLSRAAVLGLLSDSDHPCQSHGPPVIRAW